MRALVSAPALVNAAVNPVTNSSAQWCVVCQRAWLGDHAHHNYALSMHTLPWRLVGAVCAIADAPHVASQHA